MPLPHNLGLPRHMDRARSARTDWELHPKPMITLEHVLEPEFWVNILHSEPVAAGDGVRVRAEDWLYCVDLMFTEVDEGRMWAKTRVLHLHWNDAEDMLAVKDAAGWEVNWGGPMHKWRIVSPAGAIAAKGYAVRADAQEALVNLQNVKAA